MTKSGNIQSQIQTQSQVQIQSLSPQQVLEAKLLALSTLELEEQVRLELNDNPAMDEAGLGTMPEEHSADSDTETDESAEDDDAFHENDSEYGSTPDYDYDDDEWYEHSPSASGPVAEIPVSDAVSFYDILNSQLGEQDFSEHEMKIARYIIGSIDNDGILDKDLQSISDDLAFYHDVDASVEEIEKVLKVIQEFDPAGIGARNLQECLLIQIRRKPDSADKALQETVISTMFDEFTHKRFDKIESKLQISPETTKRIMAELLKLNPRPGNSLGEASAGNHQHIVPDFVIDCYDDDIHFSLNNGNVPELRVSREYSNMLENQIKSGNSSQRDAALYIKRKLDSAKGFIQAIKQREQTLTRTMQAIINRQRTFFMEGDESLLKPMALKDIAADTGYDISTVSRATSGKYVQTCFGTFPLKYFFTDGVKSMSGEEVSVKEIHRIIKELTDNEDPSAPLTDEQLTGYLSGHGYKVARRTVAKYREQIGIPVARMRKK